VQCLLTLTHTHTHTHTHARTHTHTNLDTCTFTCTTDSQRTHTQPGGKSVAWIETNAFNGLLLKSNLTEGVTGTLRHTSTRIDTHRHALTLRRFVAMDAIELVSTRIDTHRHALTRTDTYRHRLICMVYSIAVLILTIGACTRRHAFIHTSSPLSLSLYLSVCLCVCVCVQVGSSLPSCLTVISASYFSVNGDFSFGLPS